MHLLWSNSFQVFWIGYGHIMTNFSLKTEMKLSYSYFGKLPIKVNADKSSGCYEVVGFVCISTFLKRSTPPWLEAFLTTKDNAWSSIIMCQKKSCCEKVGQPFFCVSVNFFYVKSKFSTKLFRGIVYNNTMQCNSVVHFFVTCKPVLLAFWCLHVL